MAAKKVVVKGNEEAVLPPREATEVVRIEESVEDFIKSNLPRVHGATLKISTLYSSKDGSQRFRCNYWKEGANNMFVKESRFIRVDRVGGAKLFVDMTLSK